MESLVGLIVCRLRLTKLYFLLFSFVFISCKKEIKKEIEVESLPFYNTASFDAQWIKNTDPAYDIIHKIAPFALQNQLGNTITNDSLKDCVYVANFFFTSCHTICPKMASNLEKLQKSFKNNKKVKLLSFSVMPWADSVAVLNKYAKDHHIEASKWHLLTGDKEAIYTLGRKSFFAEKSLGMKKSTDEFLHTESMLLVDTKGRLRGIYNATQVVDLERVTEDIAVLLKEK